MSKLTTSCDPFVPGKEFILRQSLTGPLAGVTFAAKDMFDVAGIRTGAGNPDYERLNEPPVIHAASVRMMLEAGATLLGKVITDEMAFDVLGRNWHFGAPINPAAPKRVSGGSSSGSASAVALGRVDVALGTDTTGSVRVPASFCGIYGIRPTHDRIPIEGVVPLAPSLDTVGWFARSAEMLARVGHVLLGDRTPTPFRKLYIAEDAFAFANPLVSGVLRDWLEPIKQRFDQVESFTLLEEGFEKFFAEVHAPIQGFEGWHANGNWIEREKPNFGGDIGERFRRASLFTPEQRNESNLRRVAFRKALREKLGDDGLVVLPATAELPPPVTIDGDETWKCRMRILQSVSPASMTGFPQITVPACRVTVTGADGEEILPVGIGFMAADHHDLDLLHFAEDLPAIVTQPD